MKERELIEQMVKALEPFAEALDVERMNTYPCHTGLFTDPRRCGRCGRAIRAWEAVTAAQSFLEGN